MRYSFNIRSNYPVARLTVKGDTWLEPEEAAYPNGGLKRKGVARFADSTLRSIRAGIPDTYFSIPAVATISGRRVKGYLTLDNDEFTFHPDAASPVPVL